MAWRVEKLVAKARWALKQRGVWGTGRLIVARLLGRGRSGVVKVHPFDATYGVETSGLIEGGELPGGHAHDVYSTAYFGVPPSRLRNVLGRWRQTTGVRAVEDYAFLDVGCGKGRALLLASELPFREVAGVELNAELAHLAARNVERWQSFGLARSTIRLDCADATEVKLPDGPLLVYLYNPFGAEVLRRFLRRLDEWASANGGVVELLYLYPAEEGVLAEFPRFQRLWTESIALDPEDVGADEISTAEDPCSAYRWVAG